MSGGQWQQVAPGSYAITAGTSTTGWITTQPQQPELDGYDSAIAAPDLVGEVLAWRSWNVSAQGDLMSANGHSVWRPGPNRAVCGGIGGEWDHPAPQEKCSCGFYGLHDYGGAQDDNSVFGLFRAWGKIIVQPTGIRAEWAEVVCLVAENSSKKVQRAAGYYEVPVFTDSKEAFAYAKEGGYDVVPKELRPEIPTVELTNFQGGGMIAVPSNTTIQLGSTFTFTGTTIVGGGQKPEKKSLSMAVRAPLLLAAVACWVASIPLDSSWLLFVGWGLYVGYWLLQFPYRLALRTRCWFREVLTYTKDGRYHDAGWVWQRENRAKLGLVKGDRCPECGWRLRK